MEDFIDKITDGVEQDEPDAKPRRAIIPGSYDPVTLGHADIIRRASEEYDEVYAVIFRNPDKSYTFSLSDRVSMLMLATEGIENCLVSFSSGLVIDYMREHGIDEIVKGYRTDADYEYEMKMAEWNKKMGGYNTVLLPACDALSDISSTKVREALSSGKSVDALVGQAVASYISSLNKDDLN